MSDRGVKLQELCSRMLKEGYNYASFQDIGDKDISLETPLNEGAKPNKGLYFSKLKHYNKDFGLSNNVSSRSSRSSRSSDDSGLSNSSGEFVYPEWYKYVKDENFNVSEYEKKGIIFAKIDESKLKNVKNMTHITASGFDGFSLVPLYNWGNIKDECGIIVNDMRFIKEKGWDIPQCVIWNTDCLIKYKIFSNTGTRISYKEVKCEIKNMKKVDIIQQATEDFSKLLSSLSFWDKN
jgi:hypothetical protein